MTAQEESRLTSYIKKITTACPVCGYKVVTAVKGYGICKICGTKVIDKKITFKNKIKDMMEALK